MVEDLLDNQEQRAKGLAIASLAVSIFCIFISAGLFSFIGSIIGHIALNRLKRFGNTSHTGFAMAGIIVGYVATTLFMILMVAIFAFFVSEPTTWY
jgi:hypothetical protein